MPLHSGPVTRLRHHLRLFSWLALVAMFGLALAPSVSHALGAAGDIAEICSAPGNGEQPRKAAIVLEHCAMCAVAASSVGMPPAPVVVAPVPEGADYVAALFLDASHPCLLYTSPSPRDRG